MARFTHDVTVVNRLAGRVHDWELCEPFVYRLVDTAESEHVTVPPRFVTDFASIPRPLWWWIAPWGRHGRAAVVHDFLYQHGSITDPRTASLRRPGRLESDRIFRDAMAVLDEVILGRSRFWGRMPRPLVRFRLGLATIRRYLMWAAVVLFGFRAYQRQQAKGSSPALEHRMLEDVERLLAAEAQPT